MEITVERGESGEMLFGKPVGLSLHARSFLDRECEMQVLCRGGGGGGRVAMRAKDQFKPQRHQGHQEIQKRAYLFFSLVFLSLGGSYGPLSLAESRRNKRFQEPEGLLRRLFRRRFVGIKLHGDPSFVADVADRGEYARPVHRPLARHPMLMHPIFLDILQVNIQRSNSAISAPPPPDLPRHNKNAPGRNSFSLPDHSPSAENHGTRSNVESPAPARPPPSKSLPSSFAHPANTHANPPGKPCWAPPLVR